MYLFDNPPRPSWPKAGLGLVMMMMWMMMRMMMTKQCQFKQHSFALPDISPQPDLILPANISLWSETCKHTLWVDVDYMAEAFRGQYCEAEIATASSRLRPLGEKTFNSKTFPPHNFHFAGCPHCNHSSFPWIPRPKGDDCYLIDKDFSDMTYCYVGGLGVTRSL